MESCLLSLYLMDLSNMEPLLNPELKPLQQPIRARTYTDLTDEEKIRESVDITATNIVLQGLPQDIYNLVNHNEDAKQIWDRVKLLIQGSELSLQERESKLYDDFDTFTFKPGETIHSYYIRQHEAHANEVRVARQSYPDQIALVANSPACLNPTQYYPQLSSASQQYYTSPAPQVYQQQFQAPVLQQSYQAPTNQQQPQSSFLELDSRLVVPTFNPSDDPISSLNKEMEFLSTTFASRCTSALSTQEQEHSLIISQGVKESPKTPHFHVDPLHEILHEESTSQGSSSNVRPSHTPFELLSKWTKNHPLANVIGDPS
ncbi:hypothetical protein Tco_1218240 [Tanacetum coccineum]